MAEAAKDHEELVKVFDTDEDEAVTEEPAEP